MAQPQQRLTTRQTSAQAQRRSMNERRRAMTNRIRKNKKQGLLAQKRGVAEAAAATGTSVVMNLSLVIGAYLERSHEPTALQALHQALQQPQQQSSTFLEDPQQWNQAKLLLTRIGERLAQAVESPQQENLSEALSLMEILVQVTALSTSPSALRTTDYYGQAPPSWCELVVDHPTLLSTISEPFLKRYYIPTTTNAGWCSLIKQGCIVLGNLAQEGTTREFREKLQRSVPRLVSLVQAVLPWIAADTTTMALQHLQTSDMITVQLAIVHAATWALGNIIRADEVASGWMFCGPPCVGQGATTGHPLLTPPLLQALLLLQAPPIPVVHEQQQLQVQEYCHDISSQTAWILVLLSEREEDVVEYLLALRHHQGATDLVQAVVQRLAEFCAFAESSPQQHHQQQRGFHHPVVEPCLQVLGQWATVCDGGFVPRLLSAKVAISHDGQHFTLLKNLIQLAALGHARLLPTKDYLNVLWLSGCLLCDAGKEKHPSTVLAAPLLISMLTKTLVYDYQQLQASNIDTRSPSNTVGTTLECKREAVSALWNAIAEPPPGSTASEQQRQINARTFQRYGLDPLIKLIVQSSNISSTTNTADNSPYCIYLALKDLLLTSDLDAVAAAVHVLNIMLRRNPASVVTFMECRGEEALEAVCDRPMVGQASTEIAELAADLIDDLFNPDDGDGQFDDPVIEPAIADGGGSFVFGLNYHSPTQTVTNSISPFGGSDTPNSVGWAGPLATPGSGQSCFAFGTPEPADVPMSSSGGRGRGRGQTLPAWMAQEQRQQQQHSS